MLHSYSESVTSVHAVLFRLAIHAYGLVLILQNTQYLIEGRVQTDTCAVSCRQFVMHMLSVSRLGTTYTLLGAVSWLLGRS